MSGVMNFNIDYITNTLQNKVATDKEKRETSLRTLMLLVASIRRTKK